MDLVLNFSLVSIGFNQVSRPAFMSLCHLVGVVNLIQETFDCILKLIISQFSISILIGFFNQLLPLPVIHLFFLADLLLN